MSFPPSSDRPQGPRAVSLEDIQEMADKLNQADAPESARKVVLSPSQYNELMQTPGLLTERPIGKPLLNGDLAGTIFGARVYVARNVSDITFKS